MQNDDDDGDDGDDSYLGQLAYVSFMYFTDCGFMTHVSTNAVEVPLTFTAL